MRLTKVYVRFYKSFNYDYERKFGKTSEPDPWEFVEGAWYPFVRIDLEPSVTTVVGANESGKSHLLDAIEKVVSGKGTTEVTSAATRTTSRSSRVSADHLTSVWRLRSSTRTTSLSRRRTSASRWKLGSVSISSG